MLRERIIDEGRRDAYTRIGYLIYDVYVRMRAFGEIEDQKFEFPVTQVDLADPTGLTPVHVNRMLKQLGVSHAGLLSVAPKSATTAVSMAVSGQIGGIPSETAMLTILAGIIGAVTSSYLLNALRIRDPAVRGFSMGLASHGIATARAFQESDTAGGWPWA